jgi:hypothetical protein
MDTSSYFIGVETNSVSYYGSNGTKYVSGSNSAYGNTWGLGDIIGVALDLDAGTVKFYINNTIQNSGTAAATGLSGTFVFGCAVYPTAAIVANFGQDSSFAGNHATANANADANGHGSFAYPPQGLALCSQNLPDVDIIDGSAYMSTLLYTGNSTNNRAITGVGFSPDWVWHKARNAAYTGSIHDTVRGVGADKQLHSNTTEAENTTGNNVYGHISAFGTDGYTLTAGSNGAAPYAINNESGKTYVAWNWLAGGSASTIAADSISSGVPSIASSVSANTTSGFSIVSLTTPASGAFTFGHGLGVQPDMIIAKGRETNGYSWVIYHRSIGASVAISFSTAGAVANTTIWQNTNPSSSIVYGNSTSWGGNEDYIAYCFASTESFSKAGSYIGNGSADGTFVYTGFRPSWIMIKKSSNADGSTSGTAADGTSWQMYDNKRDIDNVVENRLIAEGTNTEGVGLDKVDFLSNGFKLRENATTTNHAFTYIYLAFAESPFKFANAR